MDALSDTGMVKSAILGTAVADGSAMGLHRIYSHGRIAQIVKAVGDTEGGRLLLASGATDTGREVVASRSSR